MKKTKIQRELEAKIEELKEVKVQELADCLYTSIPKYIANEKVKLLEKVKAICVDEDKISHCDEYGDDWVLLSDLFEYIDSEIKKLNGD